MPGKLGFLGSVIEFYLVTNKSAKPEISVN